MNYKKRSKEELINEIEELRNEISCLDIIKKELTLTLEALVESEKKYKTLLDNINEVIFILDTNNRITYISQRIREIAGYSDHELTGKYYNQFLHPHDINAFEKKINCISKTNSEIIEYRILNKNGEIRHVRTTLRPIQQDEKTAGITGVLTDITERKNYDIALIESEKKFSMLADNIADVLWVLDIDLNFVYVSPAVENVRGFSVNEILSMKLEDYLTPASYNEIVEIHREEMENEKLPAGNKLRSRTIELELCLKENKTAIVETIVSFLRDSKGQAVGILGVNRDITARKNIEKKIKESLIEKEILLREIHHRVKNNFQIITSLLSLQENKIQDDNLLQIFKDSQNRIRAMALIHERLYQSKNLASINLAEYINLIAHELFETYECSPEKIELNINTESVIMGINQAIPCGLIINEILTNSIKYAFPDNYKQNGKINIFLSRIPRSEIVKLSISDNGIGLPVSIDVFNSETLGLQLINMLSRNQLKGRLDVDRKNGTEFTIEFSN